MNGECHELEIAYQAPSLIDQEEDWKKWLMLNMLKRITGVVRLFPLNKVIWCVPSSCIRNPGKEFKTDIYFEMGNVL